MIRPATVIFWVLLVAGGPGSGAAAAVDIFGEQCASCHGADGRGRTPAGKKLGAKDLTESKLSADEISRRILEGIKDAKGKARMPAFSDKVSPSDLPPLVAYVRSLRK